MNDVYVSGIPEYADISTIVEKIVAIKAPRYVKPGQDLSDVGQEIRLICFKALDKFQQARVGRSIFHYLARCVDNGLYNQHRGIYLDNNPPCLRCEYYIKETKGCMIQESGCERIIQYRDKMARRRAVMSPASFVMGEDDEEEVSIGCVPSNTGYLDLDSHIRSTLGDKLIPYYEQMLTSGPKSVPARIRRQIQNLVQLSLKRFEV